VSLWQDWDLPWLGSEWEKKPGDSLLREFLGTRVVVVVLIQYRRIFSFLHLAVSLYLASFSLSPFCPSFSHLFPQKSEFILN
jgi:hypothetical protein